MLSLPRAIEAAESRFHEEIEKATKNKGVDPARVRRRTNEQFCERLTRASLNLSNNVGLGDPLYALTVAVPEILFAKIHYLSWGESRRQQTPQEPAPALYSEYARAFSETYKKSEIERLTKDLGEGNIAYALIGHGLSPTSDTLLLLADLGRCMRVASALGLAKTKVLLADVSWIKYNRSITQYFNNNGEMINALRICLDKRKRLYSALDLEYRVFSISDNHDGENIIRKSALTGAAEKFQSLSAALWGASCLQPHDAITKRLIGLPLGQMEKGMRDLLPAYMKAFTSFSQFSPSIEQSLRSELSILRTLSELFSTFDHEVFIYYFAQYYAQRRYQNFVKLAPTSEKKFDEPFTQKRDQFDAFMPTPDGPPPVGLSHYIYFHQYKLGRFETLPYTSVSGDIVKEKIKIEEFLASTILIEDSYDKKIDKITGILVATPTVHRNRLMSDLLSFCHFLVNRHLDNHYVSNLREVLEKIDILIAEQVLSAEDEPSKYSTIFSEWIRAISNKEAVTPFHIKPYTWEDSDWSVEMFQNCGQLVYCILEIVNDICE